jgi:hypothetical protein
VYLLSVGIDIQLNIVLEAKQARGKCRINVIIGLRGNIVTTDSTQAINNPCFSTHHTALQRQGIYLFSGLAGRLSGCAANRPSAMPNFCALRIRILHTKGLIRLLVPTIDFFLQLIFLALQPIASDSTEWVKRVLR